MLEGFRKRRKNREIVDRVWDGLVERARQPARFEEGGLPDTIMGRFEALCIEVFLFLRRCRTDAALAEMAQDIVDRFMTDLDHSLREIGIGYMGVPKRMRKLAGRFYARMNAYDGPVEAGDVIALERVLIDTALGECAGDRTRAATHLAHHMMQEAEWLGGVSTQAILSGHLRDTIGDSVQ